MRVDAAGNQVDLRSESLIAVAERRADLVDASSTVAQTRRTGYRIEDIKWKNSSSAILSCLLHALQRSLVVLFDL